MQNLGTGLHWDDLRVCFALAQTGSLSAAARALGVQPSTVGRRLAALEAHLGSRLFDRTPDGYQLTPSGHAVTRSVAPFARSVVDLERNLHGADAFPGGVVRLTVGDAFFVSMLAPRLGDLRLRHPQLTLEVITSYERVDLARRDADLAIRISPRPRQPNLVVRHLGVERFALYASPGYLARRGLPGRTSSLLGHDVIMYGSELANTPAARWLEKRAAKAVRAAIAWSMLGAAALARAGVGLAALPATVASYTGGLQLVPSQLSEARDIWLVWHEDLRSSVAVRTVADYLAEVIPRELE